MRITRAESHADLEEVRRLWRVYQDGLDESLERQGFAAEMAGLPGVYAPPRGVLLLAWDDGLEDAKRAVGTAAMRPMEAQGECELKRMVVLPEARGMGAGRALLEAIIEHAEGMYSVIKLDTSARWEAANTLYRSCGFTECARYNDDPDPDTVFMERRL